MSIVAGCGRGASLGTIPISGRVVFNSQPVTSGEVRYLPVEKEGRVARGQIDENGGFTLTTLKEGDGALPGEYRIVVLAPVVETVEASTARRVDENKGRSKKKSFGDASGPQSQVPLKYTNPETSLLTDSVNRQHSGFKELSLSE